MGGITKEERRSHKYLTDNRMITVAKRETSFEGLAEKFENGEDGIYNLITNDKNIILTPKVTITNEDIETVPGLRELRENIEQIEKAANAAQGRTKYLLKKQLIEMRRDQYTLKSIFKPVFKSATSMVGGNNKINLDDHRWIDENGEPQSDGLVSFFNPKHVYALLNNYVALKGEVGAKYSSDFYYLMEDFDKLLKKSFHNEPICADIVKLKLKGLQNTEIKDYLLKKHGKTYTTEYLSSLWCNKIPKLISERAKEDYLVWYYTFEERGTWKRCSCCGQRKLAHKRFFTRNKTSKDGFYSVCKECRNKKDK
jgi:hypothetical protein